MVALTGIFIGYGVPRPSDHAHNGFVTHAFARVNLSTEIPLERSELAQSCTLWKHLMIQKLDCLLEQPYNAQVQRIESIEEPFESG